MRHESTVVNNGNNLLPHILRGILWTTVIFSFVISTLLIATYLQIKIHDPFNSPAIEFIRNKIDQDPEDMDLRNEFRALDLIARKAYFTSQWQIRWGSILLIFFVFCFFLCLKAIYSLSSVIPGRPSQETKDFWYQQNITRKILIITGPSLIFAGLLSGFFLYNDLYLDESIDQIPAPAAYSEMMKNWPSFRGPGSNGTSHYTNIPVEWDGNSGKGIKWKTEIPRSGNSSPVVWEDLVFLTGGDSDVREVFCFNKNDGKLIWRRIVNVKPLSKDKMPKLDKETGYAPQTMACDGRLVYAIFPTGELISFDFSGKKIWSRFLGVPENHYGHSSSLITHEDLLFVQFDQRENGKVFALYGSTGKTAWEVDRKELSWASPICVNTGKRFELILTDNTSVTSYDPETGDIFWTHSCLYGEVAPSAVFAAGRVFVANEYAIAACIQLESGGKDSSKIIWEWNDDLPNTASPAASEKYVFFATADGIVSCVDAEKGSTVWYQEFDYGFYSSPVIVGNSIYLLDREGTMNIFEVSNTYKSIGNPKIGEPTVATPAYCDNLIIIRGEKNLFGIDGK
ncbi:MAG: PQQ-binding-like beta-propeller repeat protein [Chitinispirillia bacterium]|jgi:outer membrane protein assembly factor BamB